MNSQLPAGEFGREEAFQVWTETATSVSGLLCHTWDQSHLEKHPGRPITSSTTDITQTMNSQVQFKWE